MTKPATIRRGPPAQTSRDGEGGGLVGVPGVRRMLHLYWRFSRGITLGVRGAVLDAQDRVLLIRHTYASGWHMPGGGVEPAETALDALRRELEEEARIAWTGTPRLHGVFFNGAISERDHVLVYEVRAFSILAHKQPDREIAETGWFPLGALPEGTTRGTRERLLEIIEGRPLSAEW